MALRKSGLGYSLEKDSPDLNQFLFTDGLKLVQTVCLCGRNIGTEFGVGKCAMLPMNRGKRLKTKHSELPAGGTITYPGEASYKYLGFLKPGDVVDRKMKETLADTYLTRLEL